MGNISEKVSLKPQKKQVYANSFNLNPTRIPKGQSMKIDSSTILQKILFCTRALTSTRDHQKPETTETGDRWSSLKGQKIGRHLY